jgi:hypothetical protein
LLAAIFVLPPSAAAQPRVSLAEPVLLLSGKLGPHAAAGLKLDLATLQKLPQRSFTAAAPWTNGPQKYTGPLLRDVLAVAQASGSVIEAMAMNDHLVSIPLVDAQKHDVIIAHQVNDKPIGVRELGPLLIMYPFDSTPQLRTTEYYRRSVWQLKSVRVD